MILLIDKGNIILLPLIMPILIANSQHSETLMTEFIYDKLDSYIEPERKGTPKGDTIGLSRKKYEASIYNITNLKQKSLARLLDIPYGVLRKWRTEDIYKKEFRKHCVEFARRFCNRIELLTQEELRFREIGSHDDEAHEAYVEKSTQWASDGDVYGSQLCEIIRDLLEAKLVEIETRKESFQTVPPDEIYLDIVERVLRRSGMKLEPQHHALKQIVDAINRQEKKHIASLKKMHPPLLGNTPLTLSMKAMAFEKLTDEERKAIIQLLEEQLDRLRKEQ